MNIEWGFDVSPIIVGYDWSLHVNKDTFTFAYDILNIVRIILCHKVIK